MHGSTDAWWHHGLQLVYIVTHVVSVLLLASLDESIYGQKTPNPKKIDTKGFLMDFGSFDHA